MRFRFPSDFEVLAVIGAVVITFISFIIATIMAFLDLIGD
jgi:hypothetical protein